MSSRYYDDIHPFVHMYRTLTRIGLLGEWEIQYNDIDFLTEKYAYKWYNDNQVLR